ncbi:uncharacterized protein BKCO1_1500083 [Diplodia corticola]|uniref:Uncharacterized protein n=1 Tax=Diplodia corticola TaxID=236234 RepID=A0A1J9R530_9PEZI|nr:uncharacterized protein BKCO1_1500083 [Diplodia corticola]OJD35704.1 hypothetical protein BKCO1_1500083 [Diplodia corticola]
MAHDFVPGAPIYGSALAYTPSPLSQTYNASSFVPPPPPPPLSQAHMYSPPPFEPPSPPSQPRMFNAPSSGPPQLPSPEFPFYDTPRPYYREEWTEGDRVSDRIEREHIEQLEQARAQTETQDRSSADDSASTEREEDGEGAQEQQSESDVHSGMTDRGQLADQSASLPPPPSSKKIDNGFRSQLFRTDLYRSDASYTPAKTTGPAAPPLSPTPTTSTRTGGRVSTSTTSFYREDSNKKTKKRKKRNNGTTSTATTAAVFASANADGIDNNTAAAAAAPPTIHRIHHRPHTHPLPSSLLAVLFPEEETTTTTVTDNNNNRNHHQQEQEQEAATPPAARAALAATDAEIHRWACDALLPPSRPREPHARRTPRHAPGAIGDGRPPAHARMMTRTTTAGSGEMMMMMEGSEGVEEVEEGGEGYEERGEGEEGEEDPAAYVRFREWREKELRRAEESRMAPAPIIRVGAGQDRDHGRGAVGKSVRFADGAAMVRGGGGGGGRCSQYRESWVKGRQGFDFGARPMMQGGAVQFGGRQRLDGGADGPVDDGEASRLKNRWPGSIQSAAPGKLVAKGLARPGEMEKLAEKDRRDSNF